MRRRDLLKLPGAALCATVVPTSRRARPTLNTYERYRQTSARVEQRRTDLERATGRSTWDPPLGEFEHAVVEDTLAGVQMTMEPDGVALTDSYLDHSGYVPWTEIVDDTLESWSSSTHPEDLVHDREAKRAIVMALRAAADEIERSIP